MANARRHPHWVARGLGLLTALALLASSSIAGERSCFGDQIRHSKAEKIARNTIFIAEMSEDGTLLSSGTGFVVQGRGGMKLLTARHVVDGGQGQDHGGATVRVFFSDGTPLGTPRVAVASRVARERAGDVTLGGNDIALLEIADFFDEVSKARFQALDGLTVKAGSDMMVGESLGETGVSWGYSGAAAVDADGAVIGVLTGADFRDRVVATRGTIQAEDGDPARTATLPSRSLVVVEPLRDQTILAELQPQEAASSAGGFVTFAGFPSASCASTSASLEPARSAGGAALLKKWSSMDLAGVWWLPPPFSVKKLNFSARPR